MANCGVCGSFTLAGIMCALCANSKTTGVFSITNDGARERELEAIEQRWVESHRGTDREMTACLQGELNNRTLSKSEAAFIQTALYGQDGSLETIWDNRAAYHRTQPRSNFTVVYQRQANGDISVIGLGQHVGTDNKKYTIDFDCGKKGLRCQRK
ncbi:hypothetical protein EDC56_1109 [Sinobacterium caligoides]|uniref:Uncharacterized protein n=1 Tax=Sinobacterium caligoides TaxID=933926 RepID=A0A3N2E0Z0_9GAMM|nr:hypothetical protein [Sinobacterium caligoides]ROS05572.1 hypothetical protein EDC56_1109 [Sinobacterium caligoides]